MKRNQLLLILVLCFALNGCKHRSASNQSRPDTLSNSKIDSIGVQDVSLISLIANPKQYDGHQVRVIGFLNLQFEGNEIYIHKEDYDEGISKNGLWVDIEKDSLRSPHTRDCIKKNVLLEGTFDANDQGHMSMCSGGIKHITRLELWSNVVEVIHDTVRFPPSKQ